jgi:hypothetical protein
LLDSGGDCRLPDADATIVGRYLFVEQHSQTKAVKLRLNHFGESHVLEHTPG